MKNILHTYNKEIEYNEMWFRSIEYSDDVFYIKDLYDDTLSASKVCYFSSDNEISLNSGVIFFESCDNMFKGFVSNTMQKNFLNDSYTIELLLTELEIIDKHELIHHIRSVKLDKLCI